MTVLENISLAPKIVSKRYGNEVYKKAKIILERVNLNDKINDYPNELSGGQKQRVAIARTLMMEPDLLLLDEITSALDPELIKSVLNVIKKLADEGMTMIVVTHDLNFAKEVGDKFLFLEDGKIVEMGGKKIFEKPKNPRTREFINNVFSENPSERL